jgi:DNA-binding NarL/FixJ family response regulator
MERPHARPGSLPPEDMFGGFVSGFVGGFGRPGATEMLRIALIGASPQLRGELEAGLSQLGGFDVVLHAASLADARAAQFGGAEVALVDLGSLDPPPPLPGPAGPPLVLLAGSADDLGDWWRDGASLLPRGAPLVQLAAALQATAAGLSCCAPELLDRLAAAPAERPPVPAYEPLTAREQEVLRQMSFGLGNREIADALHISPHTAKFHVAQVIAKLDAGSRAHAVANALRAGLVDEAA